MDLTLEKIMKEKISADHLLYVSLKYTKTCDVMLNLIKRWTIMISDGVDGLLLKAKKIKKLKVKVIPAAPRQKMELVKKTFKKYPEITDAMKLYEFFKRVDNCPKLKEHEFRKNVRLRITDEGAEEEEEEEVVVDLEKLKEYSQILDDYIDYVKQYMLS